MLLFDPLIVLQITIWLFAILDPIAIVPYYLASNPQNDKNLAKKDARIMSLSALLILLIWGFVGLELLGFFWLEMRYFRIAWGLIIAYNAFRMVNWLTLTGNHAMGKSLDSTDSRWLIVPLTMPLVSWPGSLAFVIGLFGTGTIGTRGNIVLAILICCALYYLIVKYSVYIQKALGPLGIALMSRFMGLVLLGIGIQMILQPFLR